ncbi:MAG: bifunctional riboflavin kinase/FAD synthetase [Alphaproteobacteria bacterium]|nr:bifunctional riboflavin kinase/FAD synthetase [Alphaproteobacteria bacterium]
MQIFRHFESLPASARGATVAIGNFDGVHRGHQALLKHAKTLGDKLGVLVFEPHPQEFFKPDGERFRLTPFRAKARLLERFGVDVLYALHFDASLASLTADEFIAKVLVEGIGARHVVVGEDFQFGKGRTGNIEHLKAKGATLGFATSTFDLVGAGPEAKISSTRIREALRAGKPDVAADLLGHAWTVEGRVEHGDQRGRTIGFPTANVSLEGYLEPALGVYAVRVEIGGKSYNGVANFGRRPTFDKKDVLLEVHIFDYAGDLYGQQIVVAFIAYLRPEMKFAGLDALKAQIAKDGEEAKRRLAATR